MHLTILRPLRCWFAALGLISTALPGAEETFPRFAPVPPTAVGETLRVRHGFTMDLIAAEPLVTSPVAMCYDENGVAYVVEMRDYPYTDRGTHQAWKDNTTDAPIGRIRMLIDRDGDGVFDESIIFADNLSWPTGICAWRGGVIVTATPDIWFLKDTDGDHRADVRERLFTGFRKYNIQAVINTPLWTLDNRITFAGGTNGGQVQTINHPEVAPLKILRNDLRIDPSNGRIEAIAGGARFGHGVDDWGNRFLCNIRNPAQHVVFDGTLTARNPLLPVPNPVFDVRESGDQLPVNRISPMEPWRDFRARRWVAEKHPVPRSELVAGGVYTSAAGITIYRGAAYPAEYRGQAFVAEVANNLIQRQAVEADGVTFKVAVADEGPEFIASTDTWFRPVNFVNAPDGTLHVLDMYRETIEHPWSIPDDIRAQLDLESGRDRGRIYRLAPPGFRAPKPPRLGSASTAELVATLANPNGWWRDTAQRLLVERQEVAAVPALREGLTASPVELARLHALWTLEGIGHLRVEDLAMALRDRSGGVREHAVRVASNRMATESRLQAAVLALARDPMIRVRYQVAFAIGGLNSPEAIEAAWAILSTDAGDRWVRAAVLSAPPEQCIKLALRVLADPARPGGAAGAELVRQLTFVAGAQNRPANLGAVFAAWQGAPDAGTLEPAFWAGLGDGLRQAGRNLRTAFPDVNSPASQTVERWLGQARARVTDLKLDSAAREAAIRTLTHEGFAGAKDTLMALLQPREPASVQAAAVKALGGFSDPSVAAVLLEAWSRATPALREELLAALLARKDRIVALLAALESGRVPPGQVSGARRTPLLGHADAAIKARATALFGAGVSASRREAVEKYQPALGQPGDATRGAKVFAAVCAPCHRFNGRGFDLGPNLETTRGWDREKLLLNILDPNREVAANYLAYTIETRDGGIFNGLIADENAAGLTVRRPGLADETVLRQNLLRVTSSAQSLMPEGLETAISIAEMADLLAYLLAP
jgi:putative membrane-bound dehydrogenase-like protein